YTPCGRRQGTVLWTDQVRPVADGSLHRAARHDPRRHRLPDDDRAATTLLRREMSMPKKQVLIPKFRSETEEAAWWDKHPSVATEIMKRALKAGRAKRAVPLKTVTMRLPVPDIQAARDLAHRKGLP